jgi:hypothetical protein
MATSLTRIRLWNRRWFLLLNGVLLVALGFWWWGRNSAVAKLRAEGEPTCYADLVAEAIPDDENVAAGLRDLKSALEHGENAVSEALELLDKPPFDEKDVERARQVLEQNAETLAAVHRAIERPRYASLLKFTQVPEEEFFSNWEHSVMATKLLLLEGELAIHDREIDKGVTAAESLARLGKFYECEPLVLNRLVGCGSQNRAIALGKRLFDAGPLPGKAIQRLDDALAPLEDRSGLSQNLRTERAYMLEKYKTLPLPGRLWLDQSSDLRLYAEAIDAAEKQFAKHGSGGSFSPKTKNATFETSLLTAIQGAWEADNRVANETRSLRKKIAEASQ